MSVTQAPHDPSRSPADALAAASEPPVAPPPAAERPLAIPGDGPGRPTASTLAPRPAPTEASRRAHEVFRTANRWSTVPLLRALELDAASFVRRARRADVTRPVSSAISAGVREIAPGVYCLGPKGRTQTNVYFVGSGSSWTLIDAGWAKDGPAIKAAVEAVFGTDARPVAILLTHAHPDHAGSALELARIWGCPVYVHPAELPVAEGDFAAIRSAAGPLDIWLILPMMRAMGRRRRDAMLARASLKGVARAFDPETAVPGLPGWECIQTPGHTPGHVSFFRPSDRVLITGDAVVTMKVNSVSGFALQRQGLSGPPWYTSWNRRVAKASVATLARLEPDVLAGGHGMPMTAGTAGALRAFAER